MDDERRSPVQEPPAKKQRTLACQRCRSRKQKCEDARPCSNCVKGGEECVPTQPAPRPHIESEYVRVLEERIAELESLDPRQSLDHLGRTSSRPDQNHHDHISPTSNGTSNGVAQQAISSPMAQRSMAQRRPSALSGSSPGYAVASGNDDESDLNHLIFGLITSPSAQRSTHNASVAQASPATHQGTADETYYAAHTPIANLPFDLEDLLIEAYRERAQAQYPFFHWDTFLTWHSEWKNCLPSDLMGRAWQGFFINLVYATSLLLLRRAHVATSDARSFYSNGISLLPWVLQQPDRVLHVQAYLLLSVHALHQSSTERIISLASTTVRQCVQQQLHLGETEPEPSDPNTRIAIQVRRRNFWCAYMLDRLVSTTFDLPPSISDTMITVRPFANIEDRDLLQVAAVTPADCELADSPSYTCMSPALHILQCRRIQSEISAVTLRWDYSPQFENAPDWRIRIMAELENYKSRVQKFSDPQSKGYTSQRWLAMIYHYTLLHLYRPTKSNVVGPAGDWSVQASSQACLMFRRTQIDRQIAQPWIALLVQFQSGITLLYCFWATPPEHRTDNYDSLDVPDALRACSNILAIMADRWPKADCLRDVFELLAREIPLVDRPNKPPIRLSEKTVTAIRAHLPQVRSLVVHRSVLRMIEEMISEDFPRSVDAAQFCRPPSVAGLLAPIVEPVVQHNQPFDYGNGSTDMGNLDVDGLLSFPGVFDFDSWVVDTSRTDDFGETSRGGINQNTSCDTGHDGVSVDDLDSALLPPDVRINGDSFIVTHEYWQHPSPFLFPRDMEATYAPIGISDSDKHAGKPASEPFYTAAPLSFSHHDLASYYKLTSTSRAPNQQIVDVAKAIYNLNPVYSEGLAYEHGTVDKRVSIRQRRHNFSYECKDQSTALIARTLLDVSAEFDLIIPIRLEFGIHEPSATAVCHYGLAITLASGVQTILPICLWIFEGKITRSDAGDIAKHRQQWDRKEKSFRCMVDKFYDVPILRCTDVVLVLAKSSSRRNVPY
ncbi:Nn.00g000390.m01.CDS01 [Neocucurbitaria sp. VM-36]